MRYSVILFCRFFGAGQIVWIDIFQADEDPPHAGARAFVDEVRQRVTERVDLNDEAQFELFNFAQIDEPVEDRLPILVTSEVVVGDEEGAQPLRVIFPHDFVDVVRRAAARFSALHVDDSTERALIRTAAAGVETGQAADRALRPSRGHQRDRRAFDPRQVVHVVVERLDALRGGILQDLIHAKFRFAREQRHAHGAGAIEIGIDAAQHRHDPGNMKPADTDLDAALAQWPRDIERTRELV